MGSPARAPPVRRLQGPRLDIVSWSGRAGRHLLQEFESGGARPLRALTRGPRAHLGTCLIEATGAPASARSGRRARGTLGGPGRLAVVELRSLGEELQLGVLLLGVLQRPIVAEEHQR